MGMEVANCFRGRPLMSPVAASQPSSQLDHKKVFKSSSSGCNKSSALGVNSLDGFQGSLWPYGRQGRFCRSRSFQESRRSENRLRRVCSASLGDSNYSNYHSNEEYLQRLQELALQCHMSGENDEEEEESASVNADQKGFAECIRSTGVESSSIRNVNERKSELVNSGFGNSELVNSGFGNSRFGRSRSLNSRPFPSVKLDTSFSWPEPDWNQERINVSRSFPVTLEKKADGVGLPLSLRMLKRKQSKERGTKPRQEGFKDSLMEEGESAACSVKKAFSSMVFMIRELQNYTLQMKQIFYGDLQEVVSSVQREMQDSFVWLFQQVFSCTPSLMVSVMVLLANFTVYSMNNNIALATVSTPAATVTVFEDVGVTEALSKLVAENETVDKLSEMSSRFGDLSAAESQRLLNMGDGAGGSGGRNPAIAGGADGDAHFDGTSQNQAMFSEDSLLNRAVSSIANPASSDITSSRVEESADHIAKEAEKWEAFLKEAYEELESGTDEALDHQTMQRFIAPITVQLEPDNYICYDRTNLHYQHSISADPDNPLLLANYAQFLHLVFHDYDRADEYFQRAVKLDPSDAEVVGRYAQFLWLGRGDLEAAEEAFLDAITADPGNPFHAGSYAHFLWNTGGEDTCYPIA